MRYEIWVAIIEAFPKTLTIVGIVLLIWWFRRPIARFIIPRLSQVKIGPFELKLAQNELEQAATDKGISFTEEEAPQVLRRAAHVAPVLHGANILWVDDRPEGNRHELRLLSSLCVLVDVARDTGEAMKLWRSYKYDVVVSDIERGKDREAGLKMLVEMQRQAPGQSVEQPQREMEVREPSAIPIIFYVMRPAVCTVTIEQQWEQKAIPAGAFNITTRPDELLHLIMDALERHRL